MLKQLFILAGTVILLLIKPYSANLDVSSKYSEVISSPTSSSGGSTNFSNYNEEKRTPVCEKDEVYDDCVEVNCKAKYCSQLGYPLECKYSNNSTCHDGCVCKVGYLRADNGNCIPSKSCPSCGGDINAEFGCGINCNRHCSNIGQKAKTCTALCKENACDCKEGFYLDDNTRKCVLPKDCTSTCGINEVYSDCVQGHCGPRDCSQLEAARPCPVIDSKFCIEGCICKENYIRDYKGICIPKNKCPIFSTITNATSTFIASAPQNNIERELAEFRKGYLAFTGELLYQLVQSKPGVSFVASPLSALITFAELTLYAFGLTLEQLLSLINFKNKDQIRQLLPLIIKNFQDQKTVIFEVANKFYGNKNYPLSDTFKYEAQSVFNSEEEIVGLCDTFEAADLINKWVANKTKNRIQNLILPDTLCTDTKLICVNALYFLVNWRFQFNPNKTKNRVFHIAPNKTKSVPTMYQQATFNYTVDSKLNAQIIELDYKGGNFSYVIWLPKKKNGLLSMVEKLRDPDTFYNSMNSFRSEIVKVYLPKMDIATDTNLVDVLVKANVTEVFNPNSAVLKGILKTDVPVYMYDAIQNARIKVDETGTEAAVATGGTITTLSLPLQSPLVQDFNANRPYVFCIKYQATLIFCGVFN